jgi:hypothetical protein
MRFKDFLARGQVRNASPDISLAKALVITSKQDLEFLKGLKINETSARKIMSNYYDVLRSILEAISSIDGYKIYSHEAFTYFMKEKGEETISIKFDRFRKIRNKINYYGKDISVEEVNEYVLEILEMIRDLKEKYLKNL